MKVSCFYLLVLAVGFGIISCDKLETPYATIKNVNVDTQRKILLEDYTGHRCVNCPEATQVAEGLNITYKGHVIVMAVHAGFYSEPLPPDFPADYRVTEGIAWFNYFTLQYNPMGMINRKAFNGKQAIQYGQWPDSVAKIIQQKADALLTITNTLNQNNLSTTVTAKFKKLLAGSYNLSVCILEDSLIGPQSNNNPNIGPTPVIENYVFMNMLRGVVNGLFGDEVTNAVDTTMTYTKDFNYTLPAAWVPRHCSVVAFVFNADTKEIVQAEKKAILSK